MADLSNHFQEFATAISLRKTDRYYLRKARANIIGKLNLHFAEYSLPQIEFRVQGSFTMNTIIRSLHDPFDIDIGLYLKNMGSDTDEWPRTERVSQWIINALRDHTSFSPVNKRKCVRILYKSGSEIAYHVDLPIYIELNTWTGLQTRIGITGEQQWSQQSDPSGFTKWFFKQCERNKTDKNQLIRLVQYIKAWKDYNGQKIRMPSGMALTAIMAKKYVPDMRDDISFKETIRRCYNSLDWYLWINYIENPVQPYNNLTKKLNEDQMRKFLIRFGNLVDDMKNATSSPDLPSALRLLQNHFDTRFQ